MLIIDHGVYPEDAQVELVALSTGLVSQRRDANKFASLVYLTLCFFGGSLHTLLADLHAETY